MLFRDTRLGGDFRENERCEENGYLYGGKEGTRVREDTGGASGSDTGGGYVGVCPPIYEAANLCFMLGPLNVSCFTV